MTNPNSNVTSISDKQAAPAAKFSITCQIDGFSVTVEVEGKADSLRAMIDRLRAIGATPVQTPAPQPTKQSGAPPCPVHNTPMAPSSKRPGTYYCKSSVGQHPDDGRTLYCTKKA